MSCLLSWTVLWRRYSCGYKKKNHGHKVPIRRAAQTPRPNEYPRQTSLDAEARGAFYRRRAIKSYFLRGVVCRVQVLSIVFGRT